MATSAKKPKPNPPPPLQTEEALSIRFFRDLSHIDRKAEAWHIHDPDQPMIQVRCVECRLPMYTWSEGEDTCENCGWEIREKMQEYAQKQYHAGMPRTNSFVRGPGDQTPPVGANPGNPRFENPLAPLRTTIGKQAKSPFQENLPARLSKNPFTKE